MALGETLGPFFVTLWLTTIPSSWLLKAASVLSAGLTTQTTRKKPGP